MGEECEVAMSEELAMSRIIKMKRRCFKLMKYQEQIEKQNQKRFSSLIESLNDLSE